ncbi:MAG: DUF2029 domain-containing protein [Chloroflexi bacterium]|nr:DUF2029 domain-containing protein [Chloroflexota bacterium]MCL5110928.1 DUF2029 domain-containing protein [Chloroflexota bacterium]
MVNESKNLAADSPEAPLPLAPVPARAAVRRRLPLVGLGRGGWVNLALAALAVFYVLLFAFWVYQVGLFRYVGSDFRAVWAAAEVGRDNGFARIYDLSLLADHERQLFSMYPDNGPGMAFAVVPMPYLPVFVLPFLPLLPLGPTLGFAVWTVANLVLITLYFVRLTWAFRSAGPRRLVLPLLVLAWPVYLTLFFGQVNLLPLVGVGEFVLSLRRRRPWLAGLWLALLLIKPQLLIVLLPGLLLARQRNALLGFAVAAVAVGGGSIYMLGLDGVRDLASLVSGYVAGMPTNTPQHMMNWRSLWLNIGGSLQPEMEWAVVGVGMLLCAGAALWLWWHGDLAGDKRLSAMLLATLAATDTVAWDSHMHMALATVPALLFAVASGALPAWLATTWLVLPAVVMAAALFTIGNPMTYAALLLFGLTVLLQFWATVAFARSRQKLPLAPDVDTYSSSMPSEPSASEGGSQ